MTTMMTVMGVMNGMIRMRIKLERGREGKREISGKIQREFRCHGVV
jgi:hypothetical protein